MTEFLVQGRVVSATTFDDAGCCRYKQRLLQNYELSHFFDNRKWLLLQQPSKGVLLVEQPMHKWYEAMQVIHVM